MERLKTELAGEKEGLEAKVDGLALELSSLRSARDCADAFKAKNVPLHLLVNNAGVLAEELSEHGNNVLREKTKLLCFSLIQVKQTTITSSCIRYSYTRLFLAPCCHL